MLTGVVCGSVYLPLQYVCASFPEDMEETVEQAREMNLYCHFARGLGEARYMAAESWSSLNKTLLEVLDSYNEVNATLNLVLFEDAMAHMWVQVLELWELCWGEDRNSVIASFFMVCQGNQLASQVF